MGGVHKKKFVHTQVSLKKSLKTALILMVYINVNMSTYFYIIY